MDVRFFVLLINRLQDARDEKQSSSESDGKSDGHRRRTVCTCRQLVFVGSRDSLPALAPAAASTEPAMNQSLLKLQIGPVQDFIAQARSTRDLWSGSYLLSWLMASGLGKLTEELQGLNGPERGEGGAVIFPALENHPLRDFQSRGLKCGHELSACLTPSLPNVLVASMDAGPSKGAEIARSVTGAIDEEWRNIAQACWNKLLEDGLVDDAGKVRFDQQIRRFLSVSWQVTPWAGSYASTRLLNARRLDGVRQTRPFLAWAEGGWKTGLSENKDVLTGREEAVFGGSEWWISHIGRLRERNPKAFWPNAFRERHAGDFYGAATLVKRIWHRCYLGEEPWNVQPSMVFPIPSTSQVARHITDKDEDDEGTEPNEDEPRYFAVLAMDGDSMGAWLRGDRPGLPVEEASHRSFSQDLSKFSLTAVAPTVLKHHGTLIYAGGDDTLALLPADRALACAQGLRDEFRRVMHLDVDASVGVAIAHFKLPLQDVVRAAQQAEKRAKHQLGRSAVAVTLFKRSGETIEWGAKWDDGGLELCRTISDALEADQLSGKFTYRLAELLQAYLNQASQLMREEESFTPVKDFDEQLGEIVHREFTVAASRQSLVAGDARDRLLAVLGEHLEKHLRGLQTRFKEMQAQFEKGLAEGRLRAWERPVKPDFICGSLIGLCQTVAFANCNRPKNWPEPEPRGKA